MTMGILVVWEESNAAEEGHNLYRSTSPMDVDFLPTPLITLDPDVTSYEDGDVTSGQTYYYRVGAFTASGTVEQISNELSIEAVEGVVPQLDLELQHDMKPADVSGTTLLDLSGQNNHSTLVGGVSINTIGGVDCLTLNGTDGRIDLGARLPPSSDFTLSMYMHVPSQPTQEANPFSQYFDSGSSGRFLIRHFPPGKEDQLDIFLGGNSSPGVPISVGWNKIFLWRDDNVFHLEVEGVKVSLTSSTAIQDVIARLGSIVSGSTYTPRFFDYSYARCHIHNRVLLQIERDNMFSGI